MNGQQTHTAILFPALVDRPIGIGFGSIFISITSLFVMLGIYTGLGLYLSLLVAGIACLFVMVRFPFVWIIAVLLGFIPLFWIPTASFTPLESIHAVIFYGGIVWWFFHRIVIQRQSIRWSVGGIFYTCFFFLILLLVPISMTYEGNHFVMMRELAIFSGIFFFIPISYEVKTLKQRKLLFGLFLLILIALAIKNVVMYKQKALMAVQFWQIGASRESEAFFMLFVLSLIGITLLVGSKKIWLQLFGLLVFVLGLVACILTFYRTIWFVVLVSLIFMGFFLGKTYWVRLMKYGLLATVVGFLGFQIFLSQAVSLSDMAFSISDRFLTVKKLKKDKSLINREREAIATLDQIDWNVITGRGVGTYVHHMNLIVNKTVRLTWSHNAYTWMLFHFGVVGSVLLLLSIFSFMWKGFKLHKKLRVLHQNNADAFYQIDTFVICGLAILVGVLFISWTINPWHGRPEFLVLSFIYAFYEILERELPKAFHTSFPQSLSA